MTGFLLAWALPVLIGAAIGYVTNDIAIKMLFRPLIEKRILGLRVPFTPGILPRNRHKLAVSLGNTVSSQLLNAEVLSKRFAEDDFKEAVAATVDKLLSRLLDLRLGSLAFPEGSPAYQRVASLLSAAISSMVESPDFDATLAELAGRALDSIGRSSLGQLMGGQDSLKAARALTGLLISERGAARLRERLIEALDGWLSGDRPLAEVLPFDAPEALRKIIVAAYPEALRVLLEFLRAQEIRRELSENGREIVSALLKRLNAFQRMVVAAGRYEQAINDNMEETIADLVSHLEVSAAKREVRDLLADRAAKAAAEWAALRPDQLLKRMPDARERALGLLDRAMATLADPASAERLATALAGGIDSLRDKSLRELAVEGLGFDIADLARRLAGALHGALERSGGPEGLGRGVAGFVSSFIEARRDLSLGQLFRVSAETRAQVSGYLSGKALRLIEERVADIVSTIDVRRTVVEKIDSLDMLALERIVLDVMKEQFTWINLFGAILGGLIGLSQALLGAFL